MQWRRGFVLSLLVLAFFHPEAAAIEGVREIAVKAAVSPEFKSNPEWEKEIRNRLQFANRIFEPAFQIHFSIREFIPWKLEDETRETDLLMEELRSFIPLNQGEVVVGFHKMSRAYQGNAVLDSDILGSAQFFRGFAVLRDPVQELPETQRNVILTHELVHLFGAIHAEKEEDIMAPRVPLKPSAFLDQDNQDIVGNTRQVDFTQGLESLNETAVRNLVRIYEKRIRANPHSDFYHHLGLFYRKLKEPAKAVAIWEEARRFHYENPYIHHELGFHYFRSGRYEEAIQEIGSAVSHFVLPSQKKQLADALNFLGAAYFETGKADQAIVAWLRGLSADPENKTLQGNLAVAYIETGNLEKGITELEKLAALNPGDGMLFSNLGAAMLRAKKYSQAAEFFQKALNLKSMGAARENKGGEGELLEDFSEANIRLDLGVAYIYLKDYSSALQELLKSAQLKSDYFDIHRNLAQAYVGLQQYDSAIKEIETALRYKKDDAYLYALLAQSYADTGRKDAAIEKAREGLRYAQNDLAASIHKNLGVLYAQEASYQDAIAEFRMSLGQNWKDADTHYYLGGVYAQTGKMDEARRSLKSALQVNPGHEEAKKLLSEVGG